MKKILSIVLTFTLIVTVLSGCNKSKPTSDNKGSESNVGTSTSDIKMPSKELENTTITFLHWEDVNNESQWEMPWVSMMEQEFGITLEGTLASHESYWDTLATLVASGTSPDVAYVPSWNYITPMSNGLLQPLEDYIDFDSPLWNDKTKAVREANKWNDKTYIPINNVSFSSLLFFNKSMFKNYGIKTPQEYYLEGTWTWDKLAEIANKFVHKTSAGIVDVYGVGFQYSSFIASTGKEFVQKNSDGKGADINLKDANLAKIMNNLYDLGQGGTSALAGANGASLFTANKCAMWCTDADLMIGAFYDMYKEGNLGWVPLPKVDDTIGHYIETTFDPGWAIVSGAKNPEGAALIVEFNKWINIGKGYLRCLPDGESPADAKYADIMVETQRFGYMKSLFAKEDLDYLKEITKLPQVTNSWRSYLDSSSIAGYNEIWSGTQKWSALVEKNYPVYFAAVNSHF